MQPSLNSYCEPALTQVLYLPTNLRTALEKLSGYDMSDVRVHYNSDRPAQLQALAFAYGSDIYLAPGQDRYLPHEAWHVVQQKQDRVKPTMWLGNGMGLNDDAVLEMEAEYMGKVLIHEIHNINSVTKRNKSIVAKRIKKAIIQKVGLIELWQPNIQQLNDFEISLHNNIISRLNNKIESGKGPNNEFPQVVRLCTVELINHTPPKLKIHKPIGDIPGLQECYGLIEIDPELPNKIEEYLHKVLKKSGQLNYLQKNNLPNDEWRILIDLHYYYDRPKSQTGFHKDTVGRTLFVNLSYNNKELIEEPEFKFDPDYCSQHELFIQNYLPPVFFEDILKFKFNYGNEVDAGIKGFVAPINCLASWVDELFFHSTPMSGHRNKNALNMVMFKSWFDSAMLNYKNLFDSYQLPYTPETANNVGIFLLQLIDGMTPDNYKVKEFNLLEKVKLTEPRLLNFYKKLLNDLTRNIWPLNTGESIESGSSGNYNVGIRVFPDTAPRRKSIELDSHWIPPQSSGKRQFIRTWVQATPKSHDMDIS